MLELSNWGWVLAVVLVAFFIYKLTCQFDIYEQHCKKLQLNIRFLDIIIDTGNYVENKKNINELVKIIDIECPNVKLLNKITIVVASICGASLIIFPIGLISGAIKDINIATCITLCTLLLSGIFWAYKYRNKFSDLKREIKNRSEVLEQLIEVQEKK